MSYNIYRKCVKCGRSPQQVPGVKLSRFPKPGPKNAVRCESWARYCFPNSPWSSPDFQQKLYSENKVLCSEDQALALQEYLGSSSSQDLTITEIHDVKDHSQDVQSQPGPSFYNVLRNITNFKTQCPKDQALVHDLKSQPGSLLEPYDRQSQPGPSVEPHDRQSQTGTSVAPSIITKTQHDKFSCIKSLAQPAKTDKEIYLYKKCRKHMKKICQLKKTIQKMRKGDALYQLESNKSVAKLSKRLTPSFALMLQSQLKNVGKKFQGRRWTFDEKVVALRLFKRSPACYRLIRRMWCLPSPSTLNNLLRLFSLHVGINNNIFNSLRDNIEKLSPSQNEYILMFDEMSIRKHLEYNNKEDFVEGYQDHGVQGRTNQEATHALVFMIKAIREKEKQPITYYLSSSYVTADRLKALIMEVIEACQKIGLNIAATVCDMDGVNRRVMSLLGATPEYPFFKINGVEVVTLFDVPHLLKCFRNVFLKYDIKITTNISSNDSQGQGIAKWSHLAEFYEMDHQNNIFVFAPTLRREHLNPNAKQKMRVNLAAQVLSHSVASGLFSKIAKGDLTSEALATAELVANIDKLFDLLNANTADAKSGKPYCTNISNSSPHWKHFDKMIQLFKSMILVNCNRTPPSIMGWVWTINAVKKLFTDLKKKHKDISTISTRALQQDPLENLFGTIRANCGGNANPTVRQFVAALKSAIFSKLKHYTEGNCEYDDNEPIVKKFKKLLKPQIRTRQALPEGSATDDPVIDDFMSSITESFEESVAEPSAEMQACAYVCGFILKKNKTTCKTCLNKLITENVDNELYIFISFKEYNDYKKSLIYSSEKFVQCVAACAKKTYEILETEGHTLGIKKKITAECKNTINFTFLSECHKQDNIDLITNSVFFICIKRFYIIKNRLFKDAASAASLKRKMEIIKHT